MGSTESQEEKGTGIQSEAGSTRPESLCQHFLSHISCTRQSFLTDSMPDGGAEQKPQLRSQSIVSKERW